MVENTSENRDSAAPPQGEGGERRRGSHLWRGAVTFGTKMGANGTGWRSFVWGLGAIAVLVGAFNTINVMSVLHGRPDLAPIEPIIWEGSSWITFVSFAGIAWAALQLAPFSTWRRWRFAAVHLPALVLFSVLHVAGFMLIRVAVYAAAGSHYRGASVANFPYEFGKDILGYVLAVLAFWFAARQAPQGAAPQPVSDTFDIRDGAKLNRVKLADILAITSAGNYVEFVLGDGRKLLMRGALSTLESELAPSGFVRTHRSWLVNAAAVTALKPQGSGDYAVSLGELEVPLSRRFPDALARLRQG